MERDSTPIDNATNASAYDAAHVPGPPARQGESILVHPGLRGWRLAVLTIVLIVPVVVIGLATTVALVAMVYWLAAAGMTGLVAIVLAVLNAQRSLTLTSSR